MDAKLRVWVSDKVFMILESLMASSSFPSGLPWLMGCRRSSAQRAAGACLWAQRLGPTVGLLGKMSLGLVSGPTVIFAPSKTKSSLHAISGS